MTSGSVSLEMFELFGDTIETFRTRQSTVVELIWDSQIRQEFGERETIDVKMLSRWLAPQDRVIAALQRDHSTYSDQQVEVGDGTHKSRSISNLTRRPSLLACGFRSTSPDSFSNQIRTFCWSLVRLALAKLHLLDLLLNGYSDR